MSTRFHSIARVGVAACFAAGLSASALAHVSLRQPVAEPGSAYRAVLRVSHGCDGSPTHAVVVQLPPGFADPQAETRVGWTSSRQGSEVRWSAQDKQHALAPNAAGDFVVAGKLPATPGALWLKVQQVCEQGRSDWNQVPASGTSVEGLKTPAVLLSVQAPAPVQVQEAWLRPSVPGQLGTGGYMKLTARENLRLVSASSPLAGVAEVHEMKMDGEVMRMRAIKSLDLPAGKTVELKPGGLHLMLMDLKQALPAGSSVPVTLVLQDARGVESRVETRLQVSVTAPAGAATDEAHKH
jgi:periplasmic copper chaperone A